MIIANDLFLSCICNCLNLVVFLINLLIGYRLVEKHLHSSSSYTQEKAIISQAQQLGRFEAPKKFPSERLKSHTTLLMHSTCQSAKEASRTFAEPHAWSTSSTSFGWEHDSDIPIMETSSVFIPKSRR